MFVLEMEAMTYTYELDWYLSSVLTIEVVIQQFTFLEYPGEGYTRSLRLNTQQNKECRGRTPGTSNVACETSTTSNCSKIRPYKCKSN